MDYNHSTDRALYLGDLVSKFEAFGWMATAVNGHDHAALSQALKCVEADRPIAIIAQTTKGFGCKLMENNPAWHHRVPTSEELPLILEELS